MEVGALSKAIQSIYEVNPPDVFEFHGQWGALAVSKNQYNGFKPIEIEDYICTVIGGPILCYQDNSFLSEDDTDAGTRAIFSRWQQNTIEWDKDLSGPFAILIINKITGEITCITDLMLFIPIFKFKDKNEIGLSTHVDLLAKTTNQSSNIDTASIADFVLNNVVTYPYTFYKEISQLYPAAIHNILHKHSIDEFHSYWIPNEHNPYKNIEQAAIDLRHALSEYINKVTDNMDCVAQFISGGEDSRSIAGLLPKRLKRDAYIFLDLLNREGNIAKKVAEAYGAKFNYVIREPLHYITILEATCKLVGSGFQYFHSHSYKFSDQCNLPKYHAVFGGYASDALLKAAFSRKLWFHNRYPFIPEFYVPGITRTRKCQNSLFIQPVLSEIDSRREAHFNRVQQFRKETAEEWFVIWPMTMRTAIPNLYSNRRLFSSYEPFMSNKVVKISASVPTNWKINRQLYQKALKPYLEPTKWLIHSETGRLPYCPWWINCPLTLFFWVIRNFGRRLKIIKGNEGPWGSWNTVMQSNAWREYNRKYQEGLAKISDAFIETKPDLLQSNLPLMQKLNLLQVAYIMDKLK